MLLRVGGRRIDLDSGEVEGGGVLRPIERALVAYLAENADRPVSIDEMHTRVWAYAPSVVSRAAYSTICRVRSLIEPDPQKPVFLVTDRGNGYRLRDAEKVASSAPLPAERDAFVGRAAELADLARRQARGARLVTVMGVGGSGKTRLALRYGWERAGALQGRVWFCDLSEARKATDVAHGLARALEGVAPDAVGRALAGRGRCLVILDNFEQVADCADATIGRWLDAAPEASFVVTSRERLGLVGEQVVGLAPLTDDDARALFLLRAEAAQPGSAPDAEATDALIQALDRLPLAIELAAARLRVLSVREVLARMTDRFRLLAVGGRRADRHATLRATMDGSWELLSEDLRDALAGLAVFVGGFDLAAAEAVWGTAGLDRLQGLVDRSLVQAGAGGRFHQLLTVQDYARERLAERGGEAEVRHGRWYGSDELPRGGFGRSEADLHNIVAGCRRALARADREVAVATLRSLYGVCVMVGPYGVALELAERVLALDGLTLPMRTHARLIAGTFAMALGDPRRAEGYFDEALAGAVESGDRALEVRVAANRAGLQVRLGDRERARAEFERVLAMPDIGRFDEAAVRSNLGVVILREDPEACRRELEAALALHEAGANGVGEAIVLSNLTLLHLTGGRADEAEQCALRTLASARAVGQRRSEGLARMYLGALDARKGRWDSARAQFAEAVAIHRALGDRPGEADVRTALGRLLAQIGDPDGPVELAAGSAIRRELGDTRSEDKVLWWLG